GGSVRDGSATTVSAASSEPPPAPQAASASPPYVLPPASWSLADLKLVQRASGSDDNVDEGTARAVLSREEVNKLCALAHIEVAPGGDSAAAATGLDVAAVQRDVGAMLRCMQTMRRGDNEEGGRPLEHLGREASAAA
ncbi:unnamed protein product, partial [Laminaria digitata]